MWQEWKAYLKGEIDRPFPFAAEVRDRWLAHWEWEAFRTAREKGQEVEPPTLPAATLTLSIAAHGKPKGHAPDHLIQHGLNA